MPVEIRPYVGPRPFTETDRKLFFGRDDEAQHLVSLIVAHPLVLLHARSGAGKSSLVNAEIIPRLRRLGGESRAHEEIEDLADTEIIGPLRVGGGLRTGIDFGSIPNVFTHNALLSLNATGFATISEMLARRPHRDRNLNAPRVLIFDQFEELFTTSEERWRDRGIFLDDLGDALEQDRRLRVLFVMREEFLAGIDAYATRLPERARTRFRLEPLRRNAALLAVQKPLENTGRRFATDAAEKLVSQLLQVPAKSSDSMNESEFIEPLHLQVVCQNIWESLPADIDEITEDLISSHGNVDEALARHYERSLSKAVAAGASEGELRRWFENMLITTNETRGIAFRDRHTTAGLDNRYIEVLEHAYLLRSELRGRMTWYELSHDRFVGPILHSNKQWRQKLEHGVTTRDRFESMATEWIGSGRRSQMLDEADLRELKAWQETAAAKEVGVSTALAELIQRSEMAAALAAQSASAEEARKLRRQRSAILLLALLAFAAVIFAVVQSNRARAAREAKRELEEVERRNGAKREVAAKEAEINRVKRERVALMDAMDSAARQTFGSVAHDLAHHEQEFHALALGIRAVANAKPEILSESNAAIDSLRSASRAVGDSLWFHAPEKQVQSSGFSYDGAHALIATSDQIMVWDITVNKQLPIVQAPPQKRFDSVWAYANSKWILGRTAPANDVGGSSASSEFYFYDSVTARPLVHANSLGSDVIKIQGTPDGRYIDAFVKDRIVRINTQDGTKHESEALVRDGKRHEAYFTLTFSDDGRYAAFLREKEMRPDKPSDKENAEEDAAEEDAAEEDATSASESEPILSPYELEDAEEDADDVSVYVIDLATMQKSLVGFLPEATYSYAINVAPNSRYFTVFRNNANNQTAISFWKPGLRGAVGSETIVPRDSTSVAGSDEFLSMSESKSTIYNVATGEKLREYEVPGNTTHLATKDDGIMLLEYDAPPRHELLAWNAFTGQVVSRLTNLRAVWAADVDRSASYFLVTRADGVSRVWDTRRCPRRRSGERTCSALAFTDRRMEERLADPESLLSVACGQLFQSRRADIYAEVKHLCIGRGIAPATAMK